MAHLYDLNQIAQDFLGYSNTLTEFVGELEAVVSASDEPVNKRQLMKLYAVRDSTLQSYRNLTDVIRFLERKRD